MKNKKERQRLSTIYKMKKNSNKRQSLFSKRTLLHDLMLMSGKKPFQILRMYRIFNLKMRIYTRAELRNLN